MTRPARLATWVWFLGSSALLFVPRPEIVVGRTRESHDSESLSVLSLPSLVGATGLVAGLVVIAVVVIRKRAALAHR